MSPQHRAKQFVPFAALKGYEEALRNEERKWEETVEEKGYVPDDWCNANQN